MAGVDGGFIRQGQIRHQSKAALHLRRAAAGQIHAAAAARKQGIAAEQPFTAGDDHAAGGVARCVPDAERQLIT